MVLSSFLQSWSYGAKSKILLWTSLDQESLQRMLELKDSMAASEERCWTAIFFTHSLRSEKKLRNGW